MKTLLKRISTTKKKITDPTHQNSIFDEEKQMQQNGDDDLFQYNKNHAKKNFLIKQRQILINSYYNDEPKKQQKQIFLATIHNIKKYKNKIKQIKLEKKNEETKQIRQSVSFQYQIKRNSTEIQNELIFIKNHQHHMTLYNDKEQICLTNRKMKNTPKNIDVHHQQRKNFILNNYFTKPKTNRKSLVKQNHNKHLQKILRIRENIRLKNASLKVQDIFSNTKVMRTKNSLKRILSSNKKTQISSKEYPTDIQYPQKKHKTQYNQFQNHILSYKLSARKKSQQKDTKSHLFQQNKQPPYHQLNKINKTSSIKKSKIHSRTPQLLHQVIL